MSLSDAAQLLLQASIKGGILVLLVGLIQWIARERIPAGWRYAMWLVVFGRLLLPAAPESSLSIFNLAQPRPSLFEIAREPLPPPLITRSTTLSAAGRARQETSRPPLQLILIGIWATGFALLSARAVLASRRLSKQLRQDDSERSWIPSMTRAPAEVSMEAPEERSRAEALLAACAQQMKIDRRVRLMETPAVSSPALHGIMRPTLLLPPGLLEHFNEKELRHIFIHELAHLRRGDVAINCIAEVALWIHWFNPLVWLALLRMREERELACDRAALSLLEKEERSRYGHTILKLLDCFRTPISAPALVGMASRHDEMKRRILMIADSGNRVVSLSYLPPSSRCLAGRL